MVKMSYVDKCEECDGKGSYMTDDPHIKHEYIEVECIECDGTGVVY